MLAKLDKLIPSNSRQKEYDKQHCYHVKFKYNLEIVLFVLEV